MSISYCLVDLILDMSSIGFRFRSNKRSTTMNVRYQLSRLWFGATYLFRKVYVANKCGHKTKKKGVIHYFGEAGVMEMPLSENGNPDYCLECVGDMTIQCAWCKNPIPIGSPVTLYIPKEDFEIPEHAVRYENEGDERDSLVGCIGWECAASGADIQGHWMPPGKVKRCMSPLEMCLAGSQGEEVNMVVVSDTADYPNSASVHKVGN